MSQEWADVALCRLADTDALSQGSRDVATIYVLGYVVECYAKALCVRVGRRYLPVEAGTTWRKF